MKSSPLTSCVSCLDDVAKAAQRALGRESRGRTRIMSRGNSRMAACLGKIVAQL